MSLTTDDLSQIREVVLDALDIAVNPRLDRLEGRMDGLEGRMDRLEGRMDGLEGRMGHIEGRMARLETQLRQLTSEVRELSNRVSRLEQAMDDIQGKFTALENDIKELYRSVTNHDHPVIGSKKYLALPDDKKLLTLYEAVQFMAKHLHITLPPQHR